jgi:hypothetical protein
MMARRRRVKPAGGGESDAIFRAMILTSGEAPMTGRWQAVSLV